MASTSNKDPLELGGLEPAAIGEAIEKKKKKPLSEAELAKEARLSQKEERLSKSVKLPPPPPPPPPEPEPVEDKSHLLDKLSAYKERFPHLKKRNNVSAKSSIDDILDELHFVEMQLGSRQDGSFGAMLLHGSMVAVESIHRDVWNPLGLNLTGLAQITKDNMSEFQPIVDELMIKYGVGMYMSVETRLVLSLGAMVMTVHAANSGDPRVKVALEKMNAAVNAPQNAKDL